MKQYLLIKNNGLIIPQDIILMGSSTKRGDETKIGQFGSGSKYALSWLLRNECKPFIFSGKSEIPIETKMTEHRGIPRDVIFVNGENTNITTELGLKWTAWMALRELISNAIDEGNETVDVIYVRNDNFDQFLDEDRTSIFIPLTDAIKNVMDNYNHYFSFDRFPDFICEDGFIYLKEEESIINVYRKGIRCFDMPDHYTAYLDINFNNIPITEDRLVESGISQIDQSAKDMMRKVDDVNVLKALIKSTYMDFIPEYNELPSVWVQAYQELIDEGMRFTTNTMKNTLGILTEGKIINPKHFKCLIDIGIVSNPLETIFSHLDFVFHRTNGPSEEIINILSQFGNYKVYFGKMDTYQDIKYKRDSKEFFIKEGLSQKDHYLIAAKCITSMQTTGEDIIASILKSQNA